MAGIRRGSARLSPERTRTPAYLPGEIGCIGIETLRQIRESSVIGSVPVVMLSSCRSRLDVERAYKLGANAFYKKPISFEGYVEKVRVLVQHWLCQAELPYIYKAIA